MHVGRGVLLQNLDESRSDAETLAFELNLAVEGEGCGFQSLWVAEHHFTGYHMAPSPLQILTYLAGRTQHVRLGSMVVVLPWQEPIRVAEELAVLDHVSGGRALFGVGRGLGRKEFEGFRIEQSHSRQLFCEYAESIVDAFDTGFLESDGPLYPLPRTALRPAPLATFRGRTYASAVSPETMELMARLGFGIMVVAQKPWSTIVAEVSAYKERFIEVNGYPPPAPLLLSFVAVHEREDGAREMYDRYHIRYAHSCIDHYELHDASLAEIPGYEYYAAVAGAIAKRGTDDYANFLAGLQVHGTPDQVVDQLTENVRQLDGAGVLCVMSFGGMPSSTAEHNQALFSRDVLPRLRAIDAEREIPDHRPAAVAR